MPRVDIVTFPKLIIQIPTDEFPDAIKIVMQGRMVPKQADARTAQLASNAIKSSGLPTESNIEYTTWTESNFSKTINGMKTAEVKAPYDEVYGVIGYAHRKDSKNDTAVNVSMFTSRSNNTPSSTGSTTYNLDSVWATRFTLTKQKIDAAYIVSYVDNTIPIKQAASIITQFAGFFGDMISKLMMPSLPTPKAIASKLLGPAAAPVQNALATVAEQYAKIKPTVDQVVATAQGIVAIVQDPKKLVQYLPAIMAFLMQFVPQDKLAEVIYEFNGSGS